MQTERFRSWALWKDEFTGNLAIFCSDERFVNATLEFLRRHLDIDRCDLMVVAGGPAFIPKNEVALMERLDLLLKAHKIKQVVLVAHDDCGYYKHTHRGLLPQMLREKQRNDLLTALKEVQSKGIQVKAFFAFVDSGEVVFEEIKP
jgi:carbonic anhydrase